MHCIVVIMTNGTVMLLAHVCLSDNILTFLFWILISMLSSLSSDSVFEWSGNRWLHMNVCMFNYNAWNIFVVKFLPDKQCYWVIITWWHKWCLSFIVISSCGKSWHAIILFSVWTHINTETCAKAKTWMYTHTHTHARAHTHACAHTHTHTRTCTCKCIQPLTCPNITKLLAL